MEVIVSHEGADFDALASAQAALKIYPAARVVLGKRHGRDVREFLSLHKDRFPAVPADEIDLRAVRRLVLVDVRRASRLGHVALLRDRALARDAALEVHVWDHHAAAPDDVPAAFERVERVGSATTLLVEEIRRRGLPVDPMEATLFALGIHVDTGSLRYAGTTARDAAALAWLFDRGTRHAVIGRYLDLPFTEGQRRTLSALLPAIRVERVGGAHIGLATLPEGYGVDGLDEVTSEALALEDLHALFAFFTLHGGRVQAVARSRREWVDVGKVLRAVGGGGHATAGAASVRHADTESTLSAVLAALRAEPPRPTRVSDVMSSPVHSVGPEVAVGSLGDALAAWGHTGAPVLEDGELVGIVSRRDVTAALSKGQGADRVASHMSRPVRTTSEDALLEDALASMVAADVGRLPVLRDRRVVGIVTRRDVRDVLYGGAQAT